MRSKVVFASVTGARDFLPEANGDRRFWPVDVKQGNRAQRRARARNAGQQVQKPARPPRIINAVEYAKLRACKLTPAELATMLAPARDGLRALREGVATYLQWAAVVTAVGRAQAVEKLGIVRGMVEHFDAADRALKAVHDRVLASHRGSAWGRRTTLYFDEIQAINEALDLHAAQLGYLALSEIRQAEALDAKDVRAAAGVVITPDAPHPIQEPLL